MSLDPNSAIGQAENLNAQLADYFSKLNKFVADDTGSVLPPDFDTFVSTFDYSELYRMCTIRATDAPSYENGASIENIHHMVAITREYNMRTKTKSQYYQSAQGDYLDESNFYATMKVFWVNMLTGNTKQGETS